MGFLDRHPFGADSSDGQALMQALLAAYDQAPVVREFSLAAGLRAADFPWQASMSQVWPELLRRAADCGKLRRLVTIVAQDPGSFAYEVIARLVDEPRETRPLALLGGAETSPDHGQHLAYLE